MDAPSQRWPVEELLREARWLGALARRLVADPNLADDLVQDTWSAALRAPPERSRALRPWLASVARNALRQRLRSESRRARREAERGGESPAADPVELAGKLEAQRMLVEAVGALREPYRSTVLLAYFEQKSSAEIARLQSVAAGTVRWRLAQALDELRRHLDRRSDGERPRWLALLAPLSQNDGALLAAPAASLTGVLTMSLIWKTAAGCAAALALLCALDAGGVLELPGLGALLGRTEAPLTVEFAPLAPRDLAQPVASDGQLPERSAVAATAPAAVGEERRLLARARFVDPEQRPLAGVEMRWIPAEAVRGASGADGRIELAIPARTDDPGQFEFTCTAQGFARRALSARSAPDGVCEFGEVVLQPAGDIVGVVRDAGGRPLPGTRVSTTPTLDRPRAALDPLRRLPGSYLARDAVSADAQGRFRLSGVAAGFVLLCAEHPGHLREISRAVEVRAGQESRGVELVLAPLDPAWLVRGRVTDAEGVPVAHADLRWVLGGSSGTWQADAQGGFEFVLGPGETLDLTARDPDDRRPSASCTGLLPGGQPIELRLGSARALTLDVRDRAGAPVLAFRAWTEVRGEHDRFRRYFEDGAAQLVAPAQAFRVVVEAEGFRLWQLEVADAAAQPAQVAVVLDALPRVRGRVRTGDTPVPEVEFEVRRLATGRIVTNGFPSRLDLETLARARSDSDGRFALTVRERARIVLLVHHERFATLELGPWDYDPERGIDELDVQLDQGGAIEGRVLGPSAAGTLVGFSRGDGRAFSLRVGADGTFRAERLTPGPWTVERVAEELDPDTLSSVFDSGAPFERIPSSCVVHAGRVTRFDLGDAEAGPGIEGRITLDGRAAAGWSVELARELPEPRGATRTQTDAEGRFALGVPQSGRHALALRALTGPLDGLQALAEIEVGGPRTPWQLELASCTVEIAPPAPADGPATWKLAIELAPGAWAVSEFERGGATTLVLPAGRLRHVRLRAGQEFGREIASWPADGELVLRPAATLRLELR